MWLGLNQLIPRKRTHSHTSNGKSNGRAGSAVGAAVSGGVTALGAYDRLKMDTMNQTNQIANVAAAANAEIAHFSPLACLQNHDFSATWMFRGVLLPSAVGLGQLCNA